MSDTKLIPITQWNNYHPWPSQAGLRWLVFNEKTNGFNKVVCRAGRRVLIDELEFFKWAKSNNDHNSISID